MAEGQAKAATGNSGGGRQDDYAKIETALQQTPRGRWFLEEYTRRNRNADTALVLAAIERLEAVLMGDATPEADTAPRPSRVALPYARLKQDAETAARDVADMEQATKNATADILLATEAIQDFTWEMRDKGIDRATCETIERHTADIYAACSFEDVVYQRKENAIHLLRLMAEALEAALDRPQASSPEVGESCGVEGLSDAAPAPAARDDAEFEVPLDPNLLEAESVPEVPAEWERELGETTARPSADAEDFATEPRSKSELVSPGTAGADAPDEAGQHGYREADEERALGGASSRLDETRLAVLFG